MQGYTVGCGSNLMDVFGPCKVFSDMNSYRGDCQLPEVMYLPVCN